MKQENYLVIGKLSDAQLYSGLHRHFTQGFSYLQTLTTESVPSERQEIDGDSLYAAPASGNLRPEEEAPLEAHQRYIDIHYVLEGRERIGVKPKSECSEREPYDEARDIVFYTDKISSFIELAAGDFAIIWPPAAHAPLIGPPTEAIKKVVLKIQL